MVPRPAEKGLKDYLKILNVEKCQKLSDTASFLLTISRFCHIVCFLSHM